MRNKKMKKISRKLGFNVVEWNDGISEKEIDDFTKELKEIEE